MVTSERIKILLIEDAKIDQLLFRRMVERYSLPYDCTIAASIQQAKIALATHTYDIVLCDFFLEDGTASEIFGLISSCPLIVVTSAQDRETAITAMRAGAFDYIIKDSDQVYLKALPLTIEKALRHFQNEKKIWTLTRAIASTRDAIIIADLGGCVLYTNPTFCETFQCREDEYIGTKLPALLASDGDWSLLQYWLQTRDDEFYGEYDAIRKDGSIFPAELTGSVVRDENGEDVGGLFVIRDITQARFAEKERAQLQEQLRRAQKMEAIGVIAGGVAHDFNNILASIIGFTELSLQDAAEKSLLRSNLDEVLKAASRARDLVDQILSFSRAQGETAMCVSLSKIIEEVLQLVKVTAPVGVTLQNQLPSSDVKVFADGANLHQILLNLVTNSLQAMEGKKGSVLVRANTIKFSQVPGPARQQICASGSFNDADHSEYVVISVEDNGVGMTPEVLSHIFDPFFTTKVIGKGTGLGMVSVKRLVRSLHGAVQVESSPGEGTVVRVYLRVAESDNSSVQSSGQREVVPGEGRILFIDDEETIARFATQMLERLGYAVSAYSSSVKALEAFEKNPRSYDLVITDQTMPVIQGDEVAKRVRELRPDLPIILVSGHTERISQKEAAERGISAFLPKPLSISTFSQTVAQVLGKTEVG